MIYGKPYDYRERDYEAEQAWREYQADMEGYNDDNEGS
jgi:hypothetical protein